MSYKDDQRNKLGKLLSTLISKIGTPETKSGLIHIKFDMTDNGLIELPLYHNGERKELHMRKINVIFTPNGEGAYHREFIFGSVIKKIDEAMELMGISGGLNPESLINLFINIDGNLVKWGSMYPKPFYVPKEMKQEIIECLKSKYTTNASYTTSKGDELEYELDFDNMELDEAQDNGSAGLYLDFKIKNVEINGKLIPWRVMRESQLITAIGEDVREGDDLQMDAEDCAYRVISRDIDFDLVDDLYLNVYSYLTEVDGVNVSNADDYAEQSLDTIVGVLAKNEY